MLDYLQLLLAINATIRGVVCYPPDTMGIMAMGEADQFLQNARLSFRLASDAAEPKSVEHYSRVGREYLQRALAVAPLNMSVVKPVPSWWWPA